MSIYETFKQALFSASPELEKEICINENAQLIHFDHTVEYFKQYRPINLEDVLRAIKDKHSNDIGFFINQYGMFYNMVSEIKNPDSLDPLLVKYNCLGWTLGKPASEQSENTLKALINLLQ